jgi:hypothetical protein
LEDDESAFAEPETEEARQERLVLELQADQLVDVIGEPNTVYNEEDLSDADETQQEGN